MAMDRKTRVSHSIYRLTVLISSSSLWCLPRVRTSTTHQVVCGNFQVHFD
jgi:hypothetical protein